MQLTHALSEKFRLENRKNRESGFRVSKSMQHLCFVVAGLQWIHLLQDKLPVSMANLHNFNLRVRTPVNLDPETKCMLRHPALT
jgi:hypothetical protein